MSPEVKRLSEGSIPLGLYPWAWDGDDDVKSFNAYKDRLFVPPILTKLILDREPEKTQEWVGRVVRNFDFERIIPGHLDNYIKADKVSDGGEEPSWTSGPKNNKMLVRRASCVMRDVRYEM